MALSESAVSRAQHLPRLKRKPGGGIGGKLPKLTSQRGSSTDIQICKCSGLLQGQNSVLVTSPTDIGKLVENGCFGKGMFSRSVPTHAQLLPQVPDDKKQKRYSVEELEAIELSQRKRLKLHSQWKEEQEAHDHHSKKELHQTSSSTDSNQEMTQSQYKSSDQTECFKGGFGDDYHRFTERRRQLAENDAYPITEYLQLSSEEAFYLVHELGDLEVFNLGGKQCPANDLWKHFCEGNGRFVERYIAYRYFRKRGWVPKSGLKFGVDFLLYKEGPAVYHSSYAVVVKLTEKLSTRKCSDVADVTTDLTWQEMISLCRVNESAVKDLILSYVVKPENFSESNLKTLERLPEFEIQEVIVSRWVPERERKAM